MNTTYTYDAIGNPLTYRGNTFTWKKGRQLSTVYNSTTGDSFTFAYGADGLRTKKTVNGFATEYTYASGLLVSQTDGSTTLNFTYSADGIPRTVTYAGAQYYYLYNLQGDVIGIYNSQGSQVVSYTYDTWGKLVSVSGSLASTLGAKNPFRYRGYVYDTETGYYYLTTRYYDPETGRFLNADGYISTGEPLTGYNMFAYCGNNPIVNIDIDGSLHVNGIYSCGVESISAHSYSSTIPTVEQYFTASNVIDYVVTSLSISLESVFTSLLESSNYVKNNIIKPNNIGLGTFIRQCDQDILYYSKIINSTSKFFNVAQYSGVVVDVLMGVSDNINENAGLLFYTLTDVVTYKGKTARTWAKEWGR